MKQTIFRGVVGVILMSFIIVLTPLVISISRDQDSLILQYLIIVVFVILCAIVCGVSIGLIYYETKKNETNR